MKIRGLVSGMVAPKTTKTASEEAANAKHKRGQREDARKADLSKVQLWAEAPEKPKDLDKDASAHWDYCVDVLVPLRLLTKLDGPCLATMCRAWSIKIKAEKKIAKAVVTKVSGGQDRVSSWNKVAKEWNSVYERYADKFGMNPTARARMKLPLPKVKDNGPTNTNRSRFFGTGV